MDNYDQNKTPLQNAASPPVYCGPPPRNSTPMIHSVGPNAASIVCPSCHAHVVTKVEQKFMNTGHWACLILCLIGCWPCCFIPYCMDSCHSTEHSCPNCNAYIGSYKPS